MTSLTVKAVVILAGVLAPASPGVLEDVEARRVRYGWGLDAVSDVTLIAVEDCQLLGAGGVAIVDGVGIVPVRVIDCQQPEHVPLSDLGLVADVNRSELGHRQAELILWMP